MLRESGAPRLDDRAPQWLTFAPVVTIPASSFSSATGSNGFIAEIGARFQVFSNRLHTAGFRQFLKLLGEIVERTQAISSTTRRRAPVRVLCGSRSIAKGNRA